MKTSRSLVLSSLVALVLAAPAAAQSPTEGLAASDQQPAAGQSGIERSIVAEQVLPEDQPYLADRLAYPPVTAAEIAPDGVIFQRQEGQTLASDLVGRKVVNLEGEVVGEVSDLIFDEDNRLFGAVASVGGFLGLGSKDVALPWDRIELVDWGGEPAVVVGLTGEQLSAAFEYRTPRQNERPMSMKGQPEQVGDQTPLQPALLSAR